MEIVRAQVVVMSERLRWCEDCRTKLISKGYYPATFGSLFGNIAVRVRRLCACRCKADAQGSVTFSALATNGGIAPEWRSDVLDRMTEGGYSAAVDLGDGERVIEEYEQDLPIRDLCDGYDIRLVEICFLGPEAEDFRHVHRILRRRGLGAHKTLLVLNEGVIRHGQTPEGVFSPLVRSSEFQDLVSQGAVSVFLRRLGCLDALRERGLGYYATVLGLPDRDGVPASPTQRTMVKSWLRQHEAEHDKAGTREWLP